MTFWQIGDRVASRYNPEDAGTIISIEVSKEPYRKIMQLIKPVAPVEWCKIQFDSGNLQEHAGHELIRISDK